MLARDLGEEERGTGQGGFQHALLPSFHAGGVQRQHQLGSDARQQSVAEILLLIFGVTPCVESQLRKAFIQDGIGG